MSESNIPKLVEPNVRYFIENSLKSVHEYRMNNYSFFLNLSAVVFFVLVFALFFHFQIYFLFLILVQAKSMKRRNWE